jgi:hypothetical protein
LIRRLLLGADRLRTLVLTASMVDLAGSVECEIPCRLSGRNLRSFSQTWSKENGCDDRLRNVFVGSYFL